MKRCQDCAYRMTDNNGLCQGCAYIQITGRSRLKEAYRRLGVNHPTEEVREALRPENCTHYRKGKRLQIPGKQMVLDGSRPQRKVGLLG